MATLILFDDCHTHTDSSTVWRNYSCDDASWMLRQCGYKIVVANDAICHKAAGSGSLRPTGVMRVALECSRFKQLHSRWPETEREAALSLLAAKHQEGNRKGDEFSKIYPFARHTGTAMANASAPMEVAQRRLQAHLGAAERHHQEGHTDRHPKDH